MYTHVHTHLQLFVQVTDVLLTAVLPLSAQIQLCLLQLLPVLYVPQPV